MLQIVLLLLSGMVGTCSNSREKVKQAELVICHSIKYASILRVNLFSSQELEKFSNCIRYFWIKSLLSIQKNIKAFNHFNICNLAIIKIIV